MRLILLLSTFCFLGCASKNKNEAFLINYGMNNFEEFKNHSVFIRSWEERGRNACIMVINDMDTGVCRLPYTLILEVSTHKIVEIRNDEDKHNVICKIDTVKARELASKLLDYKATSIKVDSNNNVFVSLTNEERPIELIRSSDNKLVKDKYKNYKLIKDNWYEKVTK